MASFSLMSRGGFERPSSGDGNDIPLIYVWI